MKEYIARPNYEYELTELTEPGKLCGPTGVFVKKSDCDRAIAKAREEGRREGVKHALENTVRVRKGHEYWNPNIDVYILDGERLDALLAEGKKESHDDGPKAEID